uniref:Potassium channel domain-containing protein n=1 Tax=Spongospora subterranea TaxID=70186 RepID=A0A0H5R1G8_9EUKA|eukprot:CRZ01659.1 hypothetical protein [Spongospora subterranea]
MYWCIITLCTVGYGDLVPVTFLGKVLAASTSIAGILLLAVPISIVSGSFQTLYERRRGLTEFVNTYVSHFAMDISISGITIMFNRYKKRHQHRESKNDDRLSWAVHVVHEMTAFNYMHAMNAQLTLGDREIEENVNKFFIKWTTVEDGRTRR